MEVRIRVPTFFLQSILVGEPSPPKKGEKGTTGGPSLGLFGPPD